MSGAGLLGGWSFGGFSSGRLGCTGSSGLGIGFRHEFAVLCGAISRVGREVIDLGVEVDPNESLGLGAGDIGRRWRGSRCGLCSRSVPFEGAGACAMTEAGASIELRARA